jgi:AcrR family transcriptional regulator
MSIKRLRRPERSSRNRDRVLAAAHMQFCSLGYHGATLDGIAEEAGFSKGVIYSQFGSKDGLFLALLEQQIDRRATQIRDSARSAPAKSALLEIFEQARSTLQMDVDWMRAVIEFRIHASRSLELNQRFAALHGKSLAMRAQLFEWLAARTDASLPYSSADFARFSSVLDTGGVLERLVEGPGTAFEMAFATLSTLLRERPTSQREQATKKKRRGDPK